MEADLTHDKAITAAHQWEPVKKQQAVLRGKDGVDHPNIDAIRNRQAHKGSLRSKQQRFTPRARSQHPHTTVRDALVVRNCHPMDVISVQLVRQPATNAQKGAFSVCVQVHEDSGNGTDGGRCISWHSPCRDSWEQQLVECDSRCEWCAIAIQNRHRYRHSASLKGSH